MGFGGGGYHRGNLAAAWCAVLDEFLNGTISRIGLVG
jgi:hypothetical protein